ncbi:hypothetical protein LguiA_021664 [Lonicera macranthoides]
MKSRNSGVFAIKRKGAIIKPRERSKEKRGLKMLENGEVLDREGEVFVDSGNSKQVEDHLNADIEVNTTSLFPKIADTMIGESVPKFSDFLKDSLREAKKVKLDIEQGGGSEEEKLTSQAVYNLYNDFSEKSMLDNIDQCRKLDEAVRNRMIGEVSHMKYVTRVLFYGRLVSASSSKEFKGLERYRRSQRVSALVYNPKLRDADLDKISEVATSLFQVRDDARNITEHIENVKKVLVTDAELRDKVKRLVQSEFTGSQGLHSYQVAGYAKEFFPLKIRDLLEQKSISMTELLEYGVGVNHLMEPRLSKEARLIISGMLQRLHEVHQSGWCLKALSVDSFLVNEKYGVMLDVENLRPAKEESRIYEDYKNLRGVIEGLLKREKTPIPKDVKLFLNLLENRVNSEGSDTSEGEGEKIGSHGSNGMRLALHHTCLWSPMVMIKRIIAIAKLLLLYRMLRSTCQSENPLKSESPLIARVVWHKMIPRNTIYEKLYNNSSDSYLFTSNIFGLVVFLRDAFSHANEYATTRRERRTLEEIEKDVFVIFANILKRFTKVFSQVDPLKFIFKSKEDDDDLVL